MARQQFGHYDEGGTCAYCYEPWPCTYERKDHEAEGMSLYEWERQGRAVEMEKRAERKAREREEYLATIRPMKELAEAMGFQEIAEVIELQMMRSNFKPRLLKVTFPTEDLFWLLTMASRHEPGQPIPNCHDDPTPKPSPDPEEPDDESETQEPSNEEPF